MINILPTLEINILDIRVFSVISPEVTVDCRRCSPAFVFLMHLFLWQGLQHAKTGMPARTSAGIAPKKFTLYSIEKNALLFFHTHVHMSQKQHCAVNQFRGHSNHRDSNHPTPASQAYEDVASWFLAHVSFVCTPGSFSWQHSCAVIEP